MATRTPSWTRRGFLQAGAAALSLAALPRPVVAEHKPDDEFGGFTLGVQSFTFRNFDIEGTLKRIKEVGLKHVEFSGSKHLPATANAEQLKALLRLCKEYGVTPVCCGVYRFTKDHEANRRVFELGKTLGVRALSANPDADSFESLDKLCEEYKIAVAIHPHGPTGKDKNTLDRWYSAEAILDAVKKHHKLIGACLDTGHLIRCAQLGKKLDPAQQVRAMGDRNFGLHLKDHDNKTKEDVIFGKGVLDVPAVLKALREVKCSYAINIEYEANPTNPTDDVKQCVQVFKDSVKKLG